MTRSLIISIFLILTGCIDRFEFEADESQETPVINGFITNEEKIHKIILTNSIQFSNEKNPMLSGATVYVSDNEGNRYNFVEIQLGQYHSINRFRAEANRSYHLTIDIPGAGTFTSEPQQFIDYPPIETAGWEEAAVTRIRKTDNQIREEVGVNIYSDLENNTGEEHYYKFEIIPTWVFEAPFARTGSPVKRCYIDDLNNTFTVVKEKAGKEKFVIDFFPMSDKFRYGQSFLIQKLGMTKAAYDYWSKVKLQSDYNGTIFDPPPFSIDGNMVNTQDPSRRMLGFFGVYSESTTRIFIRREDLSYSWEYYISQCGAFSPPRRLCRDCLAYPTLSGEVTNQTPTYWVE